jgi:hypothetical protein
MPRFGRQVQGTSYEVPWEERAEGELLVKTKFSIIISICIARFD